MEILATVPPPAATGELAPSAYPRTLSGGWWPAGHVQGIAVDRSLGHVYFSFTTILVKTDLAGTVLGTVGGITGHLGDLTFDAASRKVFGSLEYKAADAFYIAVFDADAVDRVGLDATDPRVLRTVHLAQVARDFAARLPSGVRGRYGCSGIDGTAIGPRFGRPSGSRLLTVAYGVYSDPGREDNDHQVLLQYPTDGWWEVLARPLVEADPHRSGPSRPVGMQFVRTGNTTFGVQNLEYDADLRRWLLGVYPGHKPGFPNFTLFAVDAAARPRSATLSGPGGERGPVLPLAEDGILDAGTGIRGWHQRADVGIAALGGGLFYLSAAEAEGGRQSSRLTLHRWTGDTLQPLAPVEEPEPAPRASAV